MNNQLELELKENLKMWLQNHLENYLQLADGLEKALAYPNLTDEGRNRINPELAVYHHRIEFLYQQINNL